MTNLANYLENVINDTINRYLKIENFDNQDLWRNVQEEIITDTEGYSISQASEVQADDDR